VLGIVTVGTDHHRFDRLMQWLEVWDTRNPGRVRWIVQHGSSRLMNGADGFTIKPHPELLDIMKRAQLVVTQGGPGGIMDSRNCGIKPIVVPRLAELDEVVDDHQVAFSRHLEGNDLIVLAQSEAELHGALDAALSDLGSLSVDAYNHHVADAVDRFDEIVCELVRTQPPRNRR
jgi:UDP-N-acetylglucosamine transferase subunit ALG13